MILWSYITFFSMKMIIPSFIFWNWVVKNLVTDHLVMYSMISKAEYSQRMCHLSKPVCVISRKIYSGPAVHVVVVYDTYLKCNWSWIWIITGKVFLGIVPWKIFIMDKVYPQHTFLVEYIGKITQIQSSAHMVFDHQFFFENSVTKYLFLS